MDWKKPFRALKKKVKKIVAPAIEYDQETIDLLDYWQKQFEIDRFAKKKYDTLMDQWENMYNGNREFENVNRRQEKEARTVVNFPRLIVEALIDMTIPDHDFKPVTAADESSINALKSYVGYVLRSSSPSLEEMNMSDERRVSKLGGTFKKVHWNNNIKRAGYVGEIEISNPHPKDIIPNKSATNFSDDMEHYHLPINRTEKYILRKWKDVTKDMLEEKAILYAEYDEILGDQRVTTVTDTTGVSKDTGLGKYTIIETTYRDEDGDICKLWWSGDLLIKHLPKFFYRRDEDGKPYRTETIEAGTQVRKGLDEYGNISYRVVDQDIEAEYYIPTCWDIVYQPFIMRDKCAWGISIMEDVWDLQESIKKALYSFEENFLKGRKKIMTGSSEIARKLNDPTSEIIHVSDPMEIKEVDLSTNIDGVQWVNQLKEWMQLITGVTDAALGIHQPGVTSGDQAQAYISQSSNKLAIKSAYKSTSYKTLYRTIAEFALAFCDDDRPFRITGEKGESMYGEFNRLSMLRDVNGDLIYPDFDIEISAEVGFMKNKSEMMNSIVSLAGQGRFEPTPGNMLILKILDKIGVPHLKEVIGQMEQDLQQAQQMQAQEAEKQLQIQQQSLQQNQEMMLSKQQHEKEVAALKQQGELMRQQQSHDLENRKQVMSGELQQSAVMEFADKLNQIKEQEPDMFIRIMQLPAEQQVQAVMSL